MEKYELIVSPQPQEDLILLYQKKPLSVEQISALQREETAVTGSEVSFF